MLQTILFVSTIALATAGPLNWEEFSRTFRQNDVYYKQMEWIFSKKQELKKSPVKHEVCRTKGCFEIAAEFWESMNKTVDPCENFYEYACGGWKIYNPIPPSEMQWSPIQKMQKAVDYKIRELLEETVNRDDVLPVKQVKKFYQSCMNTDAIEKLGIKPLESILSQNGGWPMIMEPGEWDPEEFSWKQIHDYYTHLTQISALYEISVTYDVRNISSSTNMEDIDRIIDVEPPELPSVVLKSGESFNRTKMYEDGSYAKLITEIALIFAAEREAHVDIKQIKKDVQDIIEIEKIISNHSLYGDYENIYFSLDELQEYYDNETHHTPSSKINWRRTINDCFAEAHVTLDEDETVVLTRVQFLNELSKFLDKTNTRTIVNYIHWHFLSYMLPYTNSKVQELEYEIKKKQAGVKEEMPRWQTCVDDIHMKDAVSYLFVNKYFEEKMKVNTNKMISNIKKEMGQHILKADWLDDDMRKFALEKLKKMGQNIGYPEWYNNSTRLNNYYRGIPVGHDFFSNILNYRKFAFKERLKSLKVKPNADVWFIHPIVVNAFYAPEENTLSIPAADFQLPFYTTEPIQTINYGALGVIMGHEASHGFDDSGIQYNLEGKMFKWSKDSEEKYRKRAYCFVNQYNDFRPESSEENATSNSSEENIGEWKLGENLADSMGLDTTFDAFEHQEIMNMQPRLPGFEDLDNEQLFFLTFAKLWCENSTPEYAQMTEYDPHSAALYRVTAPLQNSEGFAKAYNCPVGSIMNPEKKCKLW